MPELPEVETVCQGLAQTITGKKIEEILYFRADARQPFPKDMPARLKGQKVLEVARRAKYVLMHLSGGDTLIGHLGMSGTLIYCDNYQKDKRGKHDHLAIRFAPKGWVVYHDPRRFGLITYTKTKDIDKHPLLSHLGPEPLSPAFNAAYLAAALRSRKGLIKPVIMDQKLVVGVGNIYASEALFRAHIFPERPANKLSLEYCKRLVSSIKDVLNDAIRSGGSTLRDYANSKGETGYFQHSFAVYGRDGDACGACGKIIRRGGACGAGDLLVSELSKTLMNSMLKKLSRVFSFVAVHSSSFALSRSDKFSLFKWQKNMYECSEILLTQGACGDNFKLP